MKHNQYFTLLVLTLRDMKHNQYFTLLVLTLRDMKHNQYFTLLVLTLRDMKHNQYFTLLVLTLRDMKHNQYFTLLVLTLRDMKHNLYFPVWSDTNREPPQRLTSRRPFWNRQRYVRRGRNEQTPENRILSRTLQQNLPDWTFLDTSGPPSTASCNHAWTTRTSDAQTAHQRHTKMRMRPGTTIR